MPQGKKRSSGLVIMTKLDPEGSIEKK